MFIHVNKNKEKNGKKNKNYSRRNIKFIRNLPKFIIQKYSIYYIYILRQTVSRVFSKNSYY